MSGNEETIRVLRAAAAVSPENLPLRLHLAETLLGDGQAAAAAEEFGRAADLAPTDPAPRLGLARALQAQGQVLAALALVEELARGASAAPAAVLLYARLLLAAGRAPEAALHYRRATERDPALADPNLAAQLAIRPGPEQAPTPPPSEPPPAPEPREEEPVRVAWEDALPEVDLPTIARSRVTFRDVGGMEGLKEEIRLKIIYPLTNPELYRAYGKSTGGGILMFGPPGCGKTHLARATSGEIEAGFMAVGLNDVLDMWLGSSERNLHSLFEQARRARPCVLFFDEVDALAASRADLRQSAGRQVINQFLAELDGLQGDNDGLLILAATNAPWHLDTAFRRPGRFDRVLFVPPPDAPARAAILHILLRDKPTQEIDYEALARKTDRFSGADLKAIVDVAIERKLQEALKSGRPQPLTTRDLQAALGSVQPSTAEWFATARNHALYANTGGLYDDILKYLKLT